jgi:UDP-glucose 4-epimerase
MTILVTGGAGYIGSHTVRALRQQGRSVVVVDDMSTGNASMTLGAPTIVGSVSDRDLMRRVFREFEVTGVIHFAASKNVGESMMDPSLYWTNNVAGTISLLSVVQEFELRTFVFSSSCSVYGTPTHVPVNEDAALNPESVYAESKHVIERILEWQSRTSPLRFAALRYFNAAGASHDAAIGEDWSKSQNLIPVVMRSLIKGDRPITIFGTDYPTTDGTAIRDYVHVEDLASAHLLALEKLEEGMPSRAINIGTGTGSSVLEVISAAEASAGKPVNYTVGSRREGDPVAVYADCTLARNILGWEARYSLADIVATAYAWHSKSS